MESSLGRNAYYDAIFRLRAARLQQLRGHKRHKAKLRDLRQYYRKHVGDFINDWGITADPRLVRKGQRAMMPFELFPRQRELIAFWYKNWIDGEYGLVEKSRDTGVSWLAVGFCVSIAVLYDDINAGFGSYKQDKVDSGPDPGSLFWKIRLYLEWLPEEFRAGYDLTRNSRHMKVDFPQTGSTIIGECGDNIGRGGRTSIYMVDETAHLEHGELADAALSANTDCRQDMSSVFGMGNTFALRAHSIAPDRKFVFDWRHDPRKSAEWYESFLHQWGPVITAQEVDRNYAASIEGVLIPANWVEACIDSDKKLGITMTGKRRGALDVADRGIDKNAYASRHGRRLDQAVTFSGKDTGDIYATTEYAFRLADIHRDESFVYDADGLGAGVRGDARKINERRANANQRTMGVVAFRGSGEIHDPLGEMVTGRTNEDFFENYKAQGYWALRMACQATYEAVVHGRAYKADDLLCIAGDIAELSQLKLELSQPTYTEAKSGKLLVVKTPEGTQSPNLADAIMMLFAPGAGPLKISRKLLEDVSNVRR